MMSVGQGTELPSVRSVLGQSSGASSFNVCGNGQMDIVHEGHMDMYIEIPMSNGVQVPSVDARFKSLSTEPQGSIMGINGDTSEK
ncbi:hypothetical protein FRB93_013237 [Tulasnella sp. JGI-2019a]|nr:hypothetical protein FRB93_013237 [Tulasnella sp. JGI-2019a]